MTQIAIRYEGDLHCLATHELSGAVIYTDAPLDNRGRGDAFSPTDLVATALGTCLVTLMAITAEYHEIDCRNIRVEVEKKMATDMPRRIVQLDVHFHLPFPPDHPKREILENAALNCPVKHSLHPDIKQNIEFFWEG